MQTPTDRARGPRAGWLYLFLSSIRCSLPVPGRAGRSCEGRGARGETPLPGRSLSCGNQDYSGCRRQRIGRVARALAGVIRSCLSSVVVFCPGRAAACFPPRATSVFCLKCTVNCAMLSPSNNCDILHKSSVPPSWRRTSFVGVQPIHPKGDSQCRAFVCPYSHVGVAFSDWWQR